MRPRPRRGLARLAALAASLILVVAACGGDDDPPPAPEPDTDVDPEPDEQADEVAPDDEGPDDEGPDDEGPDGEGPDDEGPDDEGPDDGVAMLEGEPTTEPADAQPQPGTLAVTDVRVGSHTEFDRVVFELDGDGLAGWSVRYDDEPTSQGSGEPIEYGGEHALAVAIHGVTLPPELPEGIEPWEGPIAGPEGGIVVEVVSDTIFEGIHTFVVGMTSEQPMLIGRLEDPQRVVIDLVHDD